MSQSPDPPAPDPDSQDEGEQANDKPIPQKIIPSKFNGNFPSLLTTLFQLYLARSHPFRFCNRVGRLWLCTFCKLRYGPNMPARRSAAHGYLPPSPFLPLSAYRQIIQEIRTSAPVVQTCRAL